MFQDKGTVCGAGEVVHVVHGPHDPRGEGGQEWDRGVPVPVQEQKVELFNGG